MTVTSDRELVAPTDAPAQDGRPGMDAPAIMITAKRGALFPAQELWEFRELLYFLTWRDIKVRYKQTLIGAAWAVIQPLVTMVIFTAVFHRFARIDSGDVPYPIFAFSGLLPWNLFAGALQRSVQSLVSSAPLITKVYFPRLIVPIAATLSTMVDFVVAFGVLIVMAVWLGILPAWRMISLPLPVALAMFSALAVGLWLSALNVKYRDVGHTIPFLIQVWLFASPVAYPAALVPARWQFVYSLNPMAGAIQMFRWALLGGPAPDPRMVALNVMVTAVLFAGGLVYFRRTERTFSDVI